MHAAEIQSIGMTPVKSKTVTVLEWECRHCKYRWPVRNMRAVKNEALRPKQCPNRECRAADWDRQKKKEGRPRGKR